MKLFRTLIIVVLGIGFACLFFYFLYQKYLLAPVRYFDMDEFAYMNWTSHVVQGSVPYKDFLYQLPPGFLLFLSPLFFFTNNPVAVFTSGRIAMWGVQVLLCFITMALFWQVRKSWIAIVAGVFLLFLPMPADKLMEIRPDTLGVLLTMIGVCLQVWWMEHDNVKKLPWVLFITGFFYGASIFILQKSIPQVVLATLIAFWWAYNRNKKNTLFYLLAGEAVLFLGFVFWALLIRIGPLVWYLMIDFPMQAAKLGNDFSIYPAFYFYTNDVYYGSATWNWGYIGNQLLWIGAMCVGIIRFLTPFAPRGKKGMYTEILLSASFLLQLYLYIYIFPFRHSQYLIPAAVFVAFYSADLVFIVWNNLIQKWTGVLCGFILGCGLVYFLYSGFQQVYNIKFFWTNIPDITMASEIHRVIPENSYVFDLVGLTMSYPQPYYVSCLPVGQFARYLTMPLPSLSEALERTGTDFIYQGPSKRAATLLPEDQQYLQEHFTLVFNGDLLVRKTVLDAFRERMKTIE